jgi:hypothetical protein
LVSNFGASNCDVQDLDVRFGPLALLLHHFQDACYCFPDIGHQFVHGFALGVAARQSWNLSPESAFWVFVSDDSVSFHTTIFAEGGESSYNFTAR